MLDLGWAEVLVTLGVAVAVLGKKDIPIAARTCGRMVGRTVGTLQRVRAEFTNAAKDNDLLQLKHEFEAGIRELDSIKSEIRFAGTLGSPNEYDPQRAKFSSQATKHARGAVTGSVIDMAKSAETSFSDEELKPDAAALLDSFMQPGMGSDVNSTSSPNEPTPVSDRVTKAVADNMFSPRTESMASGADLFAEGIIDSIWAAEAVAQAKAEAEAQEQQNSS